MKFDIISNIRISESGCLHLPVFHLVLGGDGFTLALPFITITIKFSADENT